MTQLEPYRVLLVDDDESLLQSMEAVLAEQFEVRCCSSAADAMSVLNRESFHVVCADWQMPGMDGIAFFQAVSRLRFALLPCFVLVTAHAGELLDRVPYEDRRMLGMLRKPFSPRQLIQRVNQFASVAHSKRSNPAPDVAASEERK